MGTNQLTSSQEKAIAALLSQPTIKQAAELAGVGESTLHRWLAEDATFAASYRSARRASVQQATARLQQASSKAVGVLVALMNNTKAPAAIRLAAASKILDTAIKAVELDDLEARIKTLEESHAKPA